MDRHADQGLYPKRRILGFTIVGLLVLLVVIVGLSILLRPTFTTTGWPGFFFFPFGFLFFLLVIFFFGWLFRPWGWWGRPYGYWHHRYGATEILKQRYARGEITKEQFEQMMRDLEQYK